MTKKLLTVIFLFFLVYSRLVGLNWGLPYPMHPDERNMAVAIQSLNCEVFSMEYFVSSIRQCLNPHFFAYGQLPLYAGYFLVQLWHVLSGRISEPIMFVEATMSLRLLSAIASILNVFVLMKIIELFFKKKEFSFFIFYFSSFIFLFSPYAVQFSHFGTTESFLMLFYSSIVYLSLKLISDEFNNKTIQQLSIISGLSIATKVSSIIFLAVPLITFIIVFAKKKNPRYFILHTSYFILLTTIFTILFSPHNLLNLKEFSGSFHYESAVAAGGVKVFYTRQFEHTIPLLFQMINVFPYALGWPVFILSIVGFVGLSWKDPKINMLRFALLIYLIPASFLFAKWSRFMAPIFPVMSIFGALMLLQIARYRLHVIRILYPIIIIVAIIPGIVYLSIYQNSDVRFTASEWIYKHIPANSYILSETANVVDIPFHTSNQQTAINNYHVISFDFYNLDSSPLLQTQLQEHLKNAEYIFVPSRRLFANHTCRGVSGMEYVAVGMEKQKCKKLIETYPILNNYYEQLFSGELRYKQVAKFTSFPKISLLGKTIFEFPDENAEETWTVFDHPVIRIYKRI